MADDRDVIKSEMIERINSGGAVDLTIIGPDGKALDMGTGFDEFTEATWVYAFEPDYGTFANDEARDIVPYENMDIVRQADRKQQEIIRKMSEIIDACEAISCQAVNDMK